MSGDITRGWGSSRLIKGSICQTELDVTSSTTFVNIPNMIHKLLGGMKYIIRGHVTGTSGSSGGAKLAIAGDGVLTASQFTATALNYNGTTLNAVSTTTTLGNAIGAATAVFTDFFFEGSIIVTKPGLLSVQLAQNVSNGTATSALVGSTVEFIATV